ncbi:MAG: ABC transporter substrate-binding protein [Nannocystaceae bacterium]|nr:ABC transporter substrate-binding protein [Myxococcales bacterium]
MAPLVSRTSIARLLPRLALGFACGALVACSLVLDFTECESNDDCVSAEPDAPLRACAENKCVAASEIQCESHTGCHALFDESFVCGTGESGAPECIKTATDECGAIRWPDEHDLDKTVIVGSIMPTTEQFSAIVQPLENAVDLAIRDFNGATELPGGRKIAWIACNSGGQAEGALASARHLAERVGTPAIIGPVFSDNLQVVAEDVTIPAGVFTISPTASAKSITTIADDGLVWRTIASDIYQAHALIDFVAREDDPGSLSVAYLAKNDAYGAGLLYDSADAIDALVGAQLALLYPNPAGMTEEELTPIFGGVVGKLFEINPDLVILAGTSEVVQIIQGYISTWAGMPDDSRPNMPRFLVTHGAVPSLTTIVETLPNPTLQALIRPQLLGISPVILDEENYSVFNTRYKITFNDQNAITSSSLSYDAAMVTMLAMATIGDAAITGRGIRDGMPRLIEGDEVSFGSDQIGLSFIPEARNALAQGQSVDLRGVSGELDFQIETGEVRTNLIHWGLVETTMGNPADVELEARCLYVLDPDPASVTGAWMGCDPPTP